jgi:hypothetical protein
VTATCPAGHESSTDDYCDVCGAAIAPPAAAAGPAAAPGAEDEAAAETAPPVAGTACPSCGAARAPGDAFCEVCGLDFATGELPQPPPPPEEYSPGAAEGAAEAAEGEVGEEGEEAPVVAAVTAEEAAEAEADTGPPPGDTGWVVVIEPDPDWYERNEAERATGEVTFPEGTTPEPMPLVGDEIVIGRRSDTRTAQPDIELEDPGVSRRHAVLRRDADDRWVIVDESSTNGTWVGDTVDAIVAGEPVPLSEGSFVNLGAYTRLTLKRT